MFIGEFHHSIDDKNRIIIPSKFREELDNSFILTRGVDNCLTIYSNEQFNNLIDEMDKLPSTNRNARKYIHVITTRANECEVDKQGRIQIPAYLKEEVGITKECAVLGVRDHVEIWDAEAWKHYYDDANDNFEDVADELSEYLR